MCKNKIMFVVHKNGVISILSIYHLFKYNKKKKNPSKRFQRKSKVVNAYCKVMDMRWRFIAELAET